MNEAWDEAKDVLDSSTVLSTSMANIEAMDDDFSSHGEAVLTSLDEMIVQVRKAVLTEKKSFGTSSRTQTLNGLQDLRERIADRLSEQVNLLKGRLHDIKSRRSKRLNSAHLMDAGENQEAKEAQAEYEAARFTLERERWMMVTQCYSDLRTFYDLQDIDTKTSAVSAVAHYASSHAFDTKERIYEKEHERSYNDSFESASLSRSAIKFSRLDPRDSSIIESIKSSHSLAGSVEEDARLHRSIESVSVVDDTYVSKGRYGETSYSADFEVADESVLNTHSESLSRVQVKHSYSPTGRPATRTIGRTEFSKVETSVVTIEEISARAERIERKKVELQELLRVKASEIDRKKQLVQIEEEELELNKLMEQVMAIDVDATVERERGAIRSRVLGDISEAAQNLEDIRQQKLKKRKPANSESHAISSLKSELKKDSTCDDLEEYPDGDFESEADSLSFSTRREKSAAVASIGGIGRSNSNRSAYDKPNMIALEARPVTRESSNDDDDDEIPEEGSSAGSIDEDIEDEEVSHSHSLTHSLTHY